MSPGTRSILLLVLFCAQSVSLVPVEEFTEDKETYGVTLPPEKPGTCPADVDYPKCEDSTVPFEHECKLDKDCDGEEKCCFSGCRRRCRLPLGAKNGDCPYFNNTRCILIKPSPAECSNDNQCQGTDRCCYYGCRDQCKSTVKGVTLPPKKPGTCPADVDYPKCEGSTVQFEHECKLDKDCDGKKKCCFSGCRRRCMQPLGAKNGDCPYFNNTKCMFIRPSPPECGNDNQCQGTDRCCYYGCRDQCKPTLKVKPGECPIPLTKCASTPPPPMCHSDFDCEGKKKCCIKFCGKACYDPRQ